MSGKGIAIAIIFLGIGVFGGLSLDCLIHRFGAFSEAPSRAVSGATEVEAGQLTTGTIYTNTDEGWAQDNHDMRTLCDPEHPLYFFQAKRDTIQYVCVHR